MSWEPLIFYYLMLAVLSQARLYMLMAEELYVERSNLTTGRSIYLLDEDELERITDYLSSG